MLQPTVEELTRLVQWFRRGCGFSPSPAATKWTFACAPHRAWIEQQVELGHNAVAIYQNLVERRDFTLRWPPGSF